MNKSNSYKDTNDSNKPKVKKEREREGEGDRETEREKGANIEGKVLIQHPDSFRKSKETILTS